MISSSDKPVISSPQSHSCLEYFTCRDAAFLGYKVSNFIVTFQEKGGKKWEYDEFFFQNQENAGERGSIVALRELSQKDKFATVLQYYSFILKGVLFPNFILYYIYI